MATYRLISSEYCFDNEIMFTLCLPNATYSQTNTHFPLKVFLTKLLRLVDDDLFHSTTNELACCIIRSKPNIS